jgi:hypothetical protein
MNTSLNILTHFIRSCGIIRSCGFFVILLGVMLSSSKPIFAQQHTSISIKASATVIEKSEIELVTINNMNIDASMAVNGIIYISAKYDATAALMMVKGKELAKFRVSFLPKAEIRNRTGRGTMILNFEMYGYESDNQGASEPIDAVERVLQISNDGKYFLWVGGRLDISKARPGVYDGEITIEIEYI